MPHIRPVSTMSETDIRQVLDAHITSLSPDSVVPLFLLDIKQARISIIDQERYF